jgi:hypothetical protein
VITVIRKAENRNADHLRGAFDHLLLAAVGLAPAGHAHVLLDPEGKKVTVEHERWAAADARAYLAALIAELFDAPHGYLLPFDALARALAGGKASYGSRGFGDLTGGLGYGPIERKDGLEPPPDAAAIARRRLGPLVERMRGDHGFEVAR